MLRLITPSILLPLLFGFQAHAESFEDRMQRIQQENALADSISEEQARLIQQTVQTNRCAKIAIAHHHRVLDQYEKATSSSELFEQWSERGEKLDKQYELDYPTYPKHIFQEYQSAAALVDGYIFALRDNDLDEKKWLNTELLKCQKNEVIK
ncbi:hypothetical protein [Vibrio makurazakiensis]|uniref:hypothetical protein n=1 Tax=Vibrio makurazakiensis TaxID=2910250 RepID=UPI003D0F59FC